MATTLIGVSSSYFGLLYPTFIPQHSFLLVQFTYFARWKTWIGVFFLPLKKYFDNVLADVKIWKTPLLSSLFYILEPEVSFPAIFHFLTYWCYS